VDVKVWSLELWKYASVKTFAKKVEEELGVVDLLLNNVA
jgi:NADP-dependent 3-hydroxy acid dehydrogenase YdfG